MIHTYYWYSQLMLQETLLSPTLCAKKSVDSSYLSGCRSSGFNLSHISVIISLSLATPNLLLNVETWSSYSVPSCVLWVAIVCNSVSPHSSYFIVLFKWGFHLYLCKRSHNLLWIYFLLLLHNDRSCRIRNYINKLYNEKEKLRKVSMVP